MSLEIRVISEKHSRFRSTEFGLGVQAVYDGNDTAPDCSSCNLHIDAKHHENGRLSLPVWEYASCNGFQKDAIQKILATPGYGWGIIHELYSTLEVEKNFEHLKQQITDAASCHPTFPTK